MSARHVARLSVPRSHPALAGHFPGHPVVPGVVVLDRVLDAFEQHAGRPARVARLAQVKFPTPLLPDQEADVSLVAESLRLGFEVTRGDELIAKGVFLLTGDDAA